MANTIKYHLSKSEQQLLKENHISKDVYTSRLRKGWSKKRAMTQPVKRRHLRPHLTKKEQLTMIDNQVTYQIYQARREAGWSKTCAIETPHKSKHKKHPYQGFSNLETSHMYAHHITPKMYQNRRHMGWTRDEAIFVPKDMKRHEIYRNDLYPITAEEFSTICRHGSTVDTYRMRRHLGWSKKRAMLTPK